MKILLADDHTLFRDALVQFIERAEPDASVYLARDLHEALEILLDNQEIDLVLLDLRMPGMDGLKGLRKVQDACPETKVVLLSGVAERHHVREAMEMGASGYFPKTMSGKAMLAAMRRIMDGERYVAMDHNTNEVMPSYYGGQEAEILEGISAEAAENLKNVRLTPREKEVLHFLLRGAANKNIARTLDLQVVTVKLHVRGICRKLGTKNRTQAALLAQQMGLVESD